MWLFTQYGFYSVVQHKDDPGRYLVRARLRQDLENLLQSADLTAQIVEDGQADYRYRIFVTGIELLHIIELFGKSIDYSNFKSRVAELSDQRERLDAYHQVWHVLSQLKSDSTAPKTGEAAPLRPQRGGGYSFTRPDSGIKYADDTYGYPPISQRDINVLLSYLPIFEKEVRPESLSNQDPASHLPPWELSSVLSAFMADFSQLGFFVSFTWMEWEQGEAYYYDPSQLAQADLLTLRKMLTTINRAERFCSGTWVGAVRNGCLVAVLRRLKELHSQLNPQSSESTEIVTDDSDTPDNDAAAVLLAGYLSRKVSDAPGRGAIYAGADGTQRYVRSYSEATLAWCDVLASQIYRDLGMNTLQPFVAGLNDSRVTNPQLYGVPMNSVFSVGERTYMASEWLIDQEWLTPKKINVGHAQEFLKGFVADVLLSNWDAAGLDLENLVVSKDSFPYGWTTSPNADTIYRTNNAGTFFMRALGKRKPLSTVSKISEWTSFFDPKINPSYHLITKVSGFQSANDIPDISAQIEAIIKLRYNSAGWSAYLEHHAPKEMLSPDRVAVAQMLETRTNLLTEKLQH